MSRPLQTSIANPLSVFLLAILLQAGVACLIGAPLPLIHDEFGYLLGADTFAHGRLVNPPHALWPFFENIHILSYPAYAMKYPPGQAFFLAMGQTICGIPYAGVVLGVAFMCGALCWMLEAIVPKRWAFAAACLALLHFGVMHYWSRSYWGGAVAACGACLVLGAYLYSRRSSGSIKYGQACAGCILLYFTRPFEGAFFLAAVAACGLWDWRQHPLPISGLRKLLIWLAVAGLSLGAFQAYYNWRATGDPLQFPYAEYARQYQYAPFLWFLAPQTPAHIAAENVDRAHSVVEWNAYENIHRLTGVQKAAWLFLRLFILLQIEFLLIVELVPILLAYGGADTLTRRLLVLAAISSIPLLLGTGLQSHYAAPFLMVTIALVAQITQVFFKMAWPRGVKPMIMILIAACAVYPPGPYGFSVEEYENVTAAAKARQALIDTLAADGNHLIFVRYARDHDIGREWIQNAADIDGQAVVWAHDLGDKRNRELCRYYPARAAWSLSADQAPLVLTPYAGCFHRKNPIPLS